MCLYYTGNLQSDAAPANSNLGMATGVVAPEQRCINPTLKVSW